MSLRIAEQLVAIGKAGPHLHADHEKTLQSVDKSCFVPGRIPKGDNMYVYVAYMAR